MLKRGSTHVIDTLAVRAIFSELPADWLVRSLDERDYGIDLSIELFAGDAPTGKMALIQVKGHEAAFAANVCISFPVKTLQYALLFGEPFFLFHTSVADKKTYFIWLQKYVTARLSVENPDWQAQGHVTLHFPSDNTLEDGRSKIEGIMAKVAARQQAFDYLSAIDRLEGHWDFLKHGETGLVGPCLLSLERMARCERFLDIYAEFDEFRPDFAKAIDALGAFARKLESSIADHPEAFQLVLDFEEHLRKMQFIKKRFLDEDQVDQLAAEISDPPY